MALRWIVEAEKDGEVRVFKSVNDFSIFLGYKQKPNGSLFKVGATTRGWTTIKMTATNRARGLDRSQSIVVHTKDGDISVSDLATKYGVSYYSALRYVNKIKSGKSPRMGLGSGPIRVPVTANGIRYESSAAASAVTGVSVGYISSYRKAAIARGENHFYAKGIRFDI